MFHRPLPFEPPRPVYENGRQIGHCNQFGELRGLYNEPLYRTVDHLGRLNDGFGPTGGYLDNLGHVHRFFER